MEEETPAACSLTALQHLPTPSSIPLLFAITSRRDFQEECAQKCSKFAGGKCNFITVNERKSGKPWSRTASSTNLTNYPWQRQRRLLEPRKDADWAGVPRRRMGAPGQYHREAELSSLNLADVRNFDVLLVHTPCFNLRHAVRISAVLQQDRRTICGRQSNHL